MSKNIIRRMRDNAECGYSAIDNLNHDKLLGKATDSQAAEGLLLGILNLDGHEGSHSIPGSPMAYLVEKAHGKVRPLISRLADVALTGSYGVEDVYHIDMKKGINSNKSLECLTTRIEDLSKARRYSQGSPFSLILVNAGVTLRGEKVGRAGSLTSSLMSLPSDVFRVGLVASPKFAEATNLDSYLKGSPEQPRADIARQPVVAVN